MTRLDNAPPTLSRLASDDPEEFRRVCFARHAAKRERWLHDRTAETIGDRLARRFRAVLGKVQP